MIKAIVTDVDGTLSDNSQKISCEALSAISLAEDAGIPVIIASGNVLPIAKAVSMYMGATGPVVSENGGLVEYRKILYPLASREKALVGVKELQKEMDIAPIFTDRWRETEAAIECSADLARIKEIVGRHGLIAEDTGFAIHIIDGKFNKMAGVKKALEIIGVLPEDVAAIGDSENDISMIKGCGLGIAVANAVFELKEAADIVTEGSHGKGVFEAVKEIVEGKY